jgi:hypothetical protein
MKDRFSSWYETSTLQLRLAKRTTENKKEKIVKI